MFKKIPTKELLKNAKHNNYVQCVRFSHGKSSDDSSNSANTSPEAASAGKSSNGELPSLPTNCCMSGCANCVWIGYAEELSSKLRNGSDIARDIIMKEVQDTNMRTFLEMELRLLKNKTPKSD